VALPPSNPDTFVREVDDAVRADRLQRFLSGYGRLVLLAIGVGLAGFAGYLFWQNHQGNVAGETGRRFSVAVDSLSQNRPRAAATSAEPLAKGDDPTYRALALMVQGDAAAAENDPRTAAARFGAAAHDADADAALRNVALLRQTLLEFDTLSPAVIIARLAPLVATPGPAFPSAAELTALAELKRGNRRAAGLLFKRIADAPDVADSLKTRANQMAGMLGADVAQAAAHAPAATPSAATPPAAAAGTPSVAAGAQTKTGE